MTLVLITTSGTGSRLKEHSKYTNKSLVKVGDKYAICHIIDSYSETTRFIITLGYYGKFVRDFLLLAYPSRDIKFVDVDCYEGPGSSLAYSMLKAKHLLQEPFYFHCCDTILTEKIEQLNSNTIFVAKHEDYMTYSSITVCDSKVTQIYTKGYENNDYIYIGIVYINDYNIFWTNLDQIYSLDKNNTSLNDIVSLSRMIDEDIYFTYKVVDNFYDTGNIISYKNTCEHFKSKYDILEKNDESLCFLDDKVIKFFYNSDTNIKRVKRGLDLYPLTPKILDYKDNFMVMEHISGTVLSEYKGYGEVNKLLEWAKENLWINPTINSRFITSCENFYYMKTLERIGKIPYLSTEYNTINNVNIGSIKSLISQVDFTILYTDTFYKFHGDFILDNILKNDNGFVLLDWRQEFDKELYYGDMYYDLAKLRHNIIFNHKNITNNLYNIEESTESIYIDIKCNYNLIKQLDDYDKFIYENKYDLKRIKILTAIIWLNMAPLYSGKLCKFLFYFGKLNLYLAMN
jgi:dTDP-glucose pyrophosphorylase